MIDLTPGTVVTIHKGPRVSAVAIYGRDGTCRINGLITHMQQFRDAIAGWLRVDGLDGFTVNVRVDMPTAETPAIVAASSASVPTPQALGLNIRRLEYARHLYRNGYISG